MHRRNHFSCLGTFSLLVIFKLSNNQLNKDNCLLDMESSRIKLACAKTRTVLETGTLDCIEDLNCTGVLNCKIYRMKILFEN